MEYRILPLAEQPAYAPDVAQATYRLWGRLIHADTGMTADAFTEVVRSRAVLDRVPLTLIALAGDRLAGTVSVKEKEASTDPDLSPWIGGLLVDEEWRGKGLGKALLTQAEAAAGRLGYEWLHLSCEPDVEHFYGQLGWTLMRRTVSCGNDVALMRKRLQPAVS